MENRMKGGDLYERQEERQKEGVLTEALWIRRKVKGALTELHEALRALDKLTGK